jgi:hypothetical protein
LMNAPVARGYHRGLRFDVPRLVSTVERYAPRYLAFTSLLEGLGAAGPSGRTSCGPAAATCCRR